MTATKLDQHEEALSEHINVVRDLSEALAEVDRLAKITDDMCDTIHGLEIRAEAAEAKLAQVLAITRGLRGQFGITQFMDAVRDITAIAEGRDDD